MINKLVVALRILKARQQVPRLSARADGASKMALEAFASTLRMNVSSREKAWIRRIESLRRELRASASPIQRVIYQARPDQSLTSAERYQGRVMNQTVGEVCRRSARQFFWCRLLMKLILKFEPETCLELGTSLGISGAYQAAALALSGRGRLVTLEGDAASASYARRHFDSLGLDNTDIILGRFHERLPEVLNRYGPIGFVYIDGDHDEQATLSYFDQIYPCLTRQAVVVFDDICWSPGMERAWRAIEADQRVRTSIDTRAVGISLIDPDASTKQQFTVPIG